MAKAVFLVGEVTIGGVTFYYTSVKINESAQLKRIPIFSTFTTPPDSEFTSLDINTIRVTFDAFMDINSLLPEPGVEQSSVTFEFEGYEYSGDVIVKDSNIDAVLDGAIRVTLNVTFTGDVTKTVAP